MLGKIALDFLPDSSFLLGGVTVNPAYKLTTALDEDQIPFLTATAIKGALRLEFEAFAGAIDLNNICKEGPKPEEETDVEEQVRGCGTCLTCRLFGGRNREAKLRFNAAILKDKDRVLPKDTRRDILEKGRKEGVAISRDLGKARDGSYFTTLTFPNLSGIVDIEFNTTIDIIEDLEGDEKPYLNAFLAFLNKTGIFIGARKSSGLGHFKIKNSMPDDSPVPMTLAEAKRDLHLYEIELHALEPMLVGGLKNLYITDTLPYIPGSTMGGSIAFALKRYYRTWDNVEALFLERQAISPFNFYIDTPFPIPTSTRERKGEKIRKDILLGDFLLKAAGTENFSDAKVKDLFENLYRNNLRPVPISIKPDTFYTTKLAIDRNLQKGRDGLLYSMELMPQGITFSGFLICEEWVSDALRDKIKELFIGGKRSKGFGRTKIEKIKKISFDQLYQTGGPIDDALRRLAKEYGITVPSDRKYFTLDMLADFPVADKKEFETVLEQELFAGTGLLIEQALPLIIRRGGYDLKQGREKPLREIVSAGSTFLVSIPLDKVDVFREKCEQMIAGSVDYEWDKTPLFVVNNPKHLEIWR